MRPRDARRSPGSACCWPARSGPRRRSPSPTRLFIAALLLGGIILPLDHLPDALAAVAGILPAAALSDALRSALGTGGDATAPLMILAGWAAAAIALTARTFRWE